MMEETKRIKLINKGGEVLAELPAYADLYHVPLSRYIDFLKAREPLDDLEKMKAGEVNEARVLAKAVGYFFGLDIETVLAAEYGEFEESETVSGNVRSLYAWIVGLIGSFTAKIRKPEDCRFEYQGETFTIPVIGLQTMVALPLLPALSTGEAVEAFEIRRIAQANLPKDTEGSHLFSYYLRLLAVLCRKDAERFPVFDSEVTTFINERSLFFRGIDTGTALDVDFFLASIMKPSKVTRTCVGFLANPVFDLVHAIQSPGKRNKTPILPPSNGRGKFSRRLGGAKPTLKSLRGVGLTARTKARSKQ